MTYDQAMNIMTILLNTGLIRIIDREDRYVVQVYFGLTYMTIIAFEKPT